MKRVLYAACWSGYLWCAASLLTGNCRPSPPSPLSRKPERGLGGEGLPVSDQFLTRRNARSAHSSVRATSASSWAVETYILLPGFIRMPSRTSSTPNA